MQLAVHEYGSKNNPPIVFLHGLGVSSWMWHDQIEALKDDFFCLAIDLPGNGDSYQSEWLTLADSANRVAQVIGEMTPNGKAHVVGLSLGGYTAVSLLAHHPETVQTMTVSGITTGHIVHSRWVGPLSNLLPHLIKFPPMVRLSAKMMQFPKDVVPLYIRDAQRLSKQTIRRIYKEVLAFQLPELPSEKLGDLLVSAGDKEAGAVLRGLDYFSELKGTAVVQAQNAHHGWNGEHPNLFSEMVRAWITHQPLPPTLTIMALPQNKVLVQ